MSADHKADARKSEGIWDTAKLVLQALAIAMVVRIFFFQPFNIPSGSMKSTLLVGDYVFVSKTSYGYSDVSFPHRLDIPWTSISIPLLPRLFSGRIWSGAPKRGDVVVFRPPHTPETDFIKRVIGLPGDRIQFKNAVLFINGTAVDKKAVGEFQTVDCDEYLERCSDAKYQRFEETLPEGEKHFTLYKPEVGPGAGNNTEEFLIKPGHYFMIGDNRNGSNDSRSWGQVPAENLVGRAVVIWFSGDEQWRFLKPWTWPTHTRWERFFNGIR